MLPSLPDHVLDWGVILVPNVLTIISLFFALNRPHESTHRFWKVLLVFLLILFDLMVVIQKQRSYRAHVAELKEQNVVLENQVRRLERLQETVELGGKKQDDMNRLIRKYDSANRMHAGLIVRQYTEVQKPKEEVTNQEIRIRGINIARKMTEFQLRYDFEQRQIAQRESQRSTQASNDYQARSKKIDAERKTLNENEIETPTFSNKRSKTNLKLLEEHQQVLNKRVEVLDNIVKETEASWKAYQDARAENTATANQERKSLAEAYVSDFRSSLLGEASYVRNQILTRIDLGTKSALPEEKESIILVFQGTLSDSQSIGAAARYLENLVTKLPQ